MSWKPSSFNRFVRVGGETVVYNTLSGVTWPLDGGEVEEALREGVGELTSGSAHLPSLGLLVREGKDQLELAREVYKRYIRLEKR